MGSTQVYNQPFQFWGKYFRDEYYINNAYIQGIYINYAFLPYVAEQEEVHRDIAQVFFP